MLNKTLATVAIILFVVISVNPQIIADDILINDKSEDEYKEIITYVIGMGFDINLSWVNKKGNFHGEAIITMGENGNLKVHSFAWNNKRIVFFKEENLSYIHAYRFIGQYEMGGFGWPYVRGIAFGNIEWFY